MITANQTKQLISECLARSAVFREKYSYWLNRNRIPNQHWFLMQFIEVLGKDRVAYILGHAVKNTQNQESNEIC